MTSELTHFNLVIHLSKAKQLAFPLFCFLCSPAAPAVPVNLTECISASVMPFGTTRNFIFFAAVSAFDVTHDMSERRRQACPLPTGVVSLVFGEVKHIVHLIRWNLNSCLCHCGAT